MTPISRRRANAASRIVFGDEQQRRDHQEQGGAERTPLQGVHRAVDRLQRRAHCDGRRHRRAR